MNQRKKSLVVMSSLFGDMLSFLGDLMLDTIARNEMQSLNHAHPISHEYVKGD